MYLSGRIFDRAGLFVEEFLRRRRKLGKMVPRKDPKYLPSKPISLKTIGDYLDLSPATISLVLNNAPGVRSIPQKTRDRVIEAARKFDYRPSYSARALRNRQTYSVGVLVPELSDVYTAMVMSGLEEVLIEEGYFYLTASHRRKADLVEEYAGLLMERSVEGIIAIDTMMAEAYSVPVINVAGHKRIEGVTNIELDHGRAAELAMRHLHQLGHRQIAFMHGQAHSADSEPRWKSMIDAARALNIDIRPELTIQLVANDASPELGYPVVSELLSRGNPFTALVCYNDIAAIGAIRAFRDRGIRVPEDVSIIGFDDIQAAAYFYPSLTTIRQPMHSMGSTAARTLLEWLRSKKVPPSQVTVLPELIIRESTMPPNPKPWMKPR
jgi:DNA-binding LacI/PurR family transcriptional regulator